MPNIFSIDLEDWFFLSKNKAYIDSSKTKDYLDNFNRNVDTILDILKKAEIYGTFFILGKVALEFPDVVKKIALEGHEIACHGFDHKRIDTMTEGEFRMDMEKAVSAIVSACGVRPKGFRAPEFSVTSNELYIFDILSDFGFKYDSSIYPISIHPKYGIGNFNLKPFIHDSGILEFPLSCAEITGARIPCSGGGYFRLYPYKLFIYLFNKCIEQGRDAIFYLHPWDLGTSFPKENMSMFSKYRYFNNTDKTYNRLKKLVNEFQFVSFSNYIDNEINKVN